MQQSKQFCGILCHKELGVGFFGFDHEPLLDEGFAGITCCRSGYVEAASEDGGRKHPETESHLVRSGFQIRKTKLLKAYKKVFHALGALDDNSVKPPIISRMLFSARENNSNSCYHYFHRARMFVSSNRAFPISSLLGSRYFLFGPADTRHSRPLR